MLEGKTDPATGGSAGWHGDDQLQAEVLVEITRDGGCTTSSILSKPVDHHESEAGRFLELAEGLGQYGRTHFR